MGKALKTVGAIVGGAVLIATGVGALQGLQVTALGIAGVGKLSVGTLNTMSAGLMAVGGMLDKPKSTGSAQPGEFTSNPDQPIPFAFGRVGAAGKVVHCDEFGPNDNMYKAYVGVLSGAGPIRSVVNFKGDEYVVTFDGNGKAITEPWRDELWMRYRLGNQPDTALTSPPGLWNNAVMPGWGAQHRLSGKACFLQIMGENSKRSAYGETGEPKPMHTFEGVFGWDPRYDSTWPGGFGPCRLNDRSTWRWIDNGAIAGLNWSLGMKENGKLVGGIGASLAGIDVPAFIEAANIADANGWKVSAWPDSSEDASQVLKQLLEAAGAVYARHAGLISCVSRGAPRPAIVTITARDTAGPFELDTGASLFNRINTITPSFMSEAHGWKHVPGSPVSFAGYVTEDGGKRGDQITYRFVPAAKQAAELAAYDILDAREPFSGTVPLKPHMRRLKRGDCFIIDEPGFMLDGVKCLVLSRSYDPKSGEVRIAFRSETDGKHDLALGKTTTLPAYPELSPVDPNFVTPPLPGDWTITPRPPAPGGAQQPGFDLGGVVGNQTATSVLVEYGQSSTGPWKQVYQGPSDVTTIPIDGLQPGATYYIAVRYMRGANYSDRQVFGPYTAPPLIAGDLSPTAPTRLAFEADIAALEALQASETVIREQAIQQVNAAMAPKNNLVPNGGMGDGARGWTLNACSATNNQSRGRVITSTNASWSAFSPSFPVFPGAALTASAYMLSQRPDGSVGVRLRWYSTSNGSGTATLSAAASIAGSGERRLASAVTVPAGAASARLEVYGFGGAGGYADASQAMVNAGTTAAPFNDATSLNAVSASVTQQSLAIVDLETQQALAKFELIAAASGGKPARFRLISSSLGSAIALDAPFIFWGDNTVFDDATDTLTTTTGAKTRVLGLGAAFGADGHLTQWDGPSSIAPAARSRANAYFYVADTAPFVGGNALNSGVFRATADKSSVNGDREGSGPVTTEPVTISVGSQTGPVTYAWSQIGGAENWTINSPASATTTFTLTVSADGYFRRATMLCRVTDTGSGSVQTVVVGTSAVAVPPGPGGS